ncbi:MAG: hypothetical protein PWQ70_1627 [Clostridiales bacterium]|nr:hypothetical protein [Clostridiales bacterium]
MNNDELKIGLALSGGGNRAAVFHLGVLKWLAEKELLEKISTISSVSGASIAIGLIYSINDYRWSTSKEYIEKVLPGIRKLMTTKDLQTGAIIRLILKPWNWNHRANILAETIFKDWGVTGAIDQLPEYPAWKISTTTFETGKNWRISQKKMGDYIFGYSLKPNIPIAVAMAASAGYPVLIGPYALKTTKYEWLKYGKDNELSVKAEPIFKKVHLWDGGVYENLGVEALFKQDKLHHDINFLLVSDASGSVDIEKRSVIKPDKKLKRLILIAIDQIRSVRARQVMSFFTRNPGNGLYIKIGNSAKYIVEQGGLADDKAQKLISTCMEYKSVLRVRNYPTDLKKLTEENFDLILRHGYETMYCTYETYEVKPSNCIVTK